MKYVADFGLMSEIPIRVVVRVRPLVGNEQEENADPSLFCEGDDARVFIGKDKQFQFDDVFNENVTQLEVYECVVSPLIKSFFDGYNVTVFAYGQTGTGKTYTMGTGNYLYLDEVEQGIVPRAVSDIFTFRQDLDENLVCNITVSFIEIYREETTDLLANASTAIQIREDEAGNTVLVGVYTEPVDSIDDVLTLLDAGTAMRHVGATNMNESSSRSHCIFTLNLEQYPISTSGDQANAGKRSCFHFVDLAGSERAHRTGNQGERFKESVSINTGLLALGNVISALGDPKRRNSHVPYRESKLTRLLKDSLGGNSRTAMITCLSPVLADLDENINSLKYASRAQKITNKPVINWDRETSKIIRMEREIQVLRNQLDRRKSDPQSEYVDAEKERMSEVQMENEKHDQNEQRYLQTLYEMNAILQAVETSVRMPSALREEIERWKTSWRLQYSSRPITAPSRSSSMRMPNIEVSDTVRTQLLKYKSQETEWRILMSKKNEELDELRQEVIAFGEENATLRLELDVARNNANDLRDCVLEQQLVIQQLRSKSNDSRNKRTLTDERPPPRADSQDRMLQRFRAKNELLMSQIDDMDTVVHDEHFSSDEDDGNRIKLPAIHQQPASTHLVISMSRHKSSIPVLSASRKRQSTKVSKSKSKPLTEILQNDKDALSRLETSRESFIQGAKTAEESVREVGIRMRKLEMNIRQKEALITELLQSEQEAKATNTIYQEKLSKVEKDYERAKKELDEATNKITQFGSAGNGKQDHTQRTQLEKEYKKKFKTAQKKLDTLKQKETATTRISSYQRNNEKRVKDLEANISRMKNMHSTLEKQLKEECDKKAKFEQELRRNELRIKELEIKTDQQQKILKRKNEEVMAAQRKLRTSDHSKVNEELEKKKQWIDSEIDKIMSRQKDMAILEAELRGRDISLRKKETLSKEKDLLEVKKSKSSMNLSKDIMELSVRMDTVDEQIEVYTSRGGNCRQLQIVKAELVAQKKQLDRLVVQGGLEVHEERRLIELGEALETVEEAIQYKNDLIAQRQLTIAEEDLDHYKNVEVLLTNMGELSKSEYKHLLGKFFLKIIELRRSLQNTDDARYRYEMKISQQEKKVQELERGISVLELRNERSVIELSSKHEKEVQFLMSQLRNVENGYVSRAGSRSAQEIKVQQLEKEMYYYKMKSRKYKEQLKDFSNNISIDTEDATEPSEFQQRNEIIEHLSSQAGHIKNNEHDDHPMPPHSVNTSHDGSNNALNVPPRHSNNDLYVPLTTLPTNNNSHFPTAIVSNGNVQMPYSTNNTGTLHLPPVKSNPGRVVKRKDSEKRVNIEQQADEINRLQEIFDSKPSSMFLSRSIKKREKSDIKNRDPSDYSYADSIEVVSKNPWQ